MSSALADCYRVQTDRILALSGTQVQTFQYPACSIEAKIFHQPHKPGLAFIKIIVMPETGQPACSNSRLVRIKFPGVQVKDKRLSPAAVYLSQARSRDAIGIKSEIPPARNRNA
jgi:hypothetical protein